MLRRIALPLIAIAGIGFSVFMIYYGSRTPPVGRILFPPPKSPYHNYIAGEGVIEAIYKNTPIGASFDNVITNIYVQVGQVVKKGDPLFKVDTRAFEAQLVQAIQAQKLAEVDYESQTVQFSFYEKLKNKSAVSEQAYQAAFYNKELAKQRLDVAVAAIKVIKTNIELSTAYAPTDGEVLQNNIHVGQFANSSFPPAALNASPANQSSLILFGDTQFYHLRVDVDEEDAWRVIKGSPATAYLRGNSKISIPLEFVYFEPYIIPKVSLSGTDIERVDTRVLQLVYKFSRDQYPVFAGQLLDVYIEAKPSEANT